MFETLKNAFKVKEIRVKIWWTLFFLLLYRLGCYIPVPGVGSTLIGEQALQDLSYLNIMSMMTGGSLQQGTWFAMGISPYINASIIIQLLTVAIPALERMSKAGEDGRRKINSITRYIAIALAVVQSIGILLSYGDMLWDPTLVTDATPLAVLLGNQKWLAYVVAVVFYASGTAVTIWIGERITDYGVSNGISILIFIGIISSAGNYFLGTIQTIADPATSATTALTQFWGLVGYLVAIIVIFGCIVFVDLAERKIHVQYAKQVKGRKMYGGQSTVIPIKVNANGVMPLIFSFSILSFPELLMSMFGWSEAQAWWQRYLGTSSWLYPIVLCLLILGFAYFYTTLQFNPEDIARSIQQNGGFIPGIRPGAPTLAHLKKISSRITLFGAIFLALVALVPSLIFTAISEGGAGVFTATGMLIAVSVGLEFNTALESQIMMKNYKGFLK